MLLSKRIQWLYGVHECFMVSVKVVCEGPGEIALEMKYFFLCKHENLT